jgi:hypothetical protein
MFLTNIGFIKTEDGIDEPYLDPISCETMDVLQDLGSILALARGVSGRKRLYKELRRVRRHILQIGVVAGGDRLLNEILQLQREILQVINLQISQIVTAESPAFSAVSQTAGSDPASNPL